MLNLNNSEYRKNLINSVISKNCDRDNAIYALHQGSMYVSQIPCNYIYADFNEFGTNYSNYWMNVDNNQRKTIIIMQQAANELAAIGLGVRP